MNDSLDGASAALPLLSPGAAREPLVRARIPVLPWAALRAGLWLPAVLVLALLLTAALQTLSVSVQTLAGHTVMTTATGLIGALATMLFVQRTRATHQLCDRVMAIAFGVLSAMALILAAVPLVGAGADHSWQWLTLAVQLAAAGVLAATAVSLALGSPGRADGLQRSIVAGVIVLAVAQLDYFLLPATNNGSLYGGDVLTLAAYMLILYGCGLEFRALQRRLVVRAAVAERRRMARDMHDGLAQELAFIATYSQRLGRTGDDIQTVAHLRAAAERALHDSRTAIAVLTSTDDEPMDRLITRTVESFRSRFAVEVELDLEQGVIVDAERRNALLRILHEALVNAIRHGSARKILVCLTAGEDGPSLRISDDGCGFDVPAAVTAGAGLGLISMRERAELLGGGLDVVSTSGIGTVVEVGLP
jgi:signal transduction histidine kinase